MTATEPERLLGDYLLYNDRQAAPMKSQQDRNSDATNWHASLDGGNLSLILPDEDCR